MSDWEANEPEQIVTGLPVLDANAGGSEHRVLTDAPGALSSDFFVNLLDRAAGWDKVMNLDRFDVR